jgi:hypothetical protein
VRLSNRWRLEQYTTPIPWIWSTSDQAAALEFVKAVGHGARRDV